MPILMIVAADCPAHAGAPIAQWVQHEAQEFDGFDIDYVDLASLELPLASAPDPFAVQPRTAAWRRQVTSADAFIFVTPEYNRGAPPIVKNAIDSLGQEWSYKPVGLVTFAGASAGIGATAALAPTLFTLGMIGVRERVELAFAERQIVDGMFYPEAENVVAMCNQLAALHELITWNRQYA